MEELPAFDNIYREYLDQVSRIDFHRVKDRLGLSVKGEEIVIPFYGMLYTVSAKGVFGPNGRRPSHSVTVVLCKYLLLAPGMEPTQADWVTYKDFKDAPPFVGGFRSNVEENISQAFSGRLFDLEKACLNLDARPLQESFPSQLAMRFDALPRVPILLLFNDKDEEFPSHCSLLFERRAEKYLDMECLAILGWILAEWLKASPW